MNPYSGNVLRAKHPLEPLGTCEPSPPSPRSVSAPALGPRPSRRRRPWVARLQVWGQNTRPLPKMVEGMVQRCRRGWGPKAMHVKDVRRGCRVQEDTGRACWIFGGVGDGRLLGVQPRSVELIFGTVRGRDLTPAKDANKNTILACLRCIFGRSCRHLWHRGGIIPDPATSRAPPKIGPSIIYPPTRQSIGSKHRVSAGARPKVLGAILGGILETSPKTSSAKP